MNTGKYTLKEFLTNHNLDQIIIPEIQRDYVWQEENVERFLQSIFDNSKRQNDLSQGVTDEFLDSLAPEMREVVLRAQKEKQNYCNVGFIYAYSDPEMPDRYVLIDGQQRMTTLFLIILALSVKEKQQDNFRRAYFKDTLLKLDYKVREDSHQFLLNFVKYILDGNDIVDVSNKYWNFTEYQNDKTIQSIISNYQVISNFIDDNIFPLSYVENYIEFWYFDTNKSKQGEELYLYMNSRGETVSPNESIKANLLKGLSSQEKHEWGTKWEQWQDLFWKYRQTNNNADRGIEEFLKWIKFIEVTKSNKEQASLKLSETIRKTKDSKKISSDGLSLQTIESYFIAIEKLIELKDELKFNLSWLTGNNIQTIEYVKLLPMLMYAENHSDCNNIEIKRFARFFFNITRFDAISKSPYNSLVDAILLTSKFIKDGFTDIVNIVDYSEKFKGILSDEEIIKLSIYKQSSEALRLKIENTFWQAEDHKYCDGKIGLIWDCINFNVADLLSFDVQKLLDFNDCFSDFKVLFENPTDLVRRALLTKGDYLVYDGYSTSLEQDRYSFIKEEKRWKEQLYSKEKTKLYKSLIKDFGGRKKVENATKDDILNQIIADFLTKKTEKDWIYYFVKEPSLLSYCRDKKICWDEDIEYIALLEATKVMEHNWCLLKDKVQFEKQD